MKERAYEEARKVLKDKPAPTSISEVNELRYIDCVVKETLRLFPILPFVTRRTTEEFELGISITNGKIRIVNSLSFSDGYKIPSGTQAICHIFGVQRSPEYYTDPNKFDPERFTPENSKARHPFAYIPFSAGPRNCLGKVDLYEIRIL